MINITNTKKQAAPIAKISENGRFESSGPIGVIKLPVSDVILGANEISRLSRSKDPVYYRRKALPRAI